jgi:hypothetical protein
LEIIMLTPRKTRTRKPSTKFRLTSQISTTISITFLNHLLSTGESKSNTIRTALSTYAHKHKQIKDAQVPDEFRPSTEINQRTEVRAVLNPPSLLTEYERHAQHLGINTSELLLRCLCLHLRS